MRAATNVAPTRASLSRERKGNQENLPGYSSPAGISAAGGLLARSSGFFSWFCMLRRRSAPAGHPGDRRKEPG